MWSRLINGVLALSMLAAAGYLFYLARQDGDGPILPGGETPAPALDAEHPPNPPAFNVPAIIVALGAVLIALHAVLSNVSDDWYSYVILRFAFIPITYDLPISELPEPSARFWSTTSFPVARA